MIFKVAVLQMRSENRAYEDNIKVIIRNMTEAKKNNADNMKVNSDNKPTAGQKSICPAVGVCNRAVKTRT